MDFAEWVFGVSVENELSRKTTTNPLWGIGYGNKIPEWNFQLDMGIIDWNVPLGGGGIVKKTIGLDMVGKCSLQSVLAQ